MNENVARALEESVRWGTGALISSIIASILIVFFLLIRRRLRQPGFEWWIYAFGCVILVRLLWLGDVPSSARLWHLPTFFDLWQDGEKPVRDESPGASSPHSFTASGAEGVSIPTVAVGNPPLAWETEKLAPDSSSDSLAGGGNSQILKDFQPGSGEPELGVREIPLPHRLSGSGAHGGEPINVDVPPGVHGLGEQPRNGSGDSWLEEKRVQVVLGLIWAGGVLAVAGSIFVRRWKFRSRVRRLSTPVGAELERQLVECGRGRCGVQVLALEGLHSPIVYGFLNPRILVSPQHIEDLGEEEWRHVLTHEWMHIRAGDHLVNWGILASQAIHWWNPLVWLFTKRLVADRELLRDRQALRLLGEDSDSRRAYGRTILKLSQSCHVAKPAPGLAAIIQAEKETTHRIKMIAKSNNETRGALKAGAGFALLGLVAIVSTVALGQETPEAVDDDAPAALPPVEASSTAEGADEYGSNGPTSAEGADEYGSNGPTSEPASSTPPSAGAGETVVSAVRRSGMLEMERQRLEEGLARVDAELEKVNLQVGGLSDRGLESRPILKQELEALLEVRREILTNLYRLKFLGHSQKAGMTSPEPGAAPPPPSWAIEAKKRVYRGEPSVQASPDSGGADAGSGTYRAGEDGAMLILDGGSESAVGDARGEFENAPSAQAKKLADMLSKKIDITKELESRMENLYKAGSATLSDVLEVKSELLALQQEKALLTGDTAKAKELLQARLDGLARLQQDYAQKIQAGAGNASPSDLLKIKRDRLSVEMELANLETQGPDSHR